MYIGSLLAFFVLALGVTSAPAQQAKPAADTSVVALLRKHDDAMKRHDIDAVMALFAPGEKTVMIGTGPGERWVGKDEIRSAYVEFFKDFDKGSLTRTCEWASGEAQKASRTSLVPCSRHRESERRRHR
jgi:ketosteroid isomerase-like protein